MGLKVRIVTVLTLNDGVLFRTKKFRPDYRYTPNYVDLDAPDELCILDITRDGPSPAFAPMLDFFTARCFCPVSAGGWITTVAHAKELMRTHGVDKVVINTHAFENRQFIGELANTLGSQSVVVSIDVGENGNVWIDRGRRDTGTKAVDWAIEAVQAGAGELLLQSIGRDGSLAGYDAGVYDYVTRRVSAPVIWASGCGGWHHLISGFRAGASGCGVTNIHHFTKASLVAARRACQEAGIPVRPMND